MDRSLQSSCLLLYFYTENPDMSGNVLKKCIFKYEPYFYIVVKSDMLEDFQQYLSKYFEDKISSTEIIEKVDLDMPNHLSGIKKRVIKVNFKNIANLVSVRNTLRPIVQKNKTKEKVLTYTELLNPSTKVDIIEMIQDLREDDIPYHVRVCIDNEIRCGCWYKVNSAEQGCVLTHLPDKLTKCPLTVLAFDIETTKVPLKFPDPRIDSIMLISYMIDGDGYLITNRDIISEDIDDFQYMPKPEFDGYFHIFNEKDEAALLKRFINHCKERRPNIFVTFNGDYFDIPFIAERLKVHGMTLEESLGLQNTTNSSKPGEGEYMGRFAVHIDCLYWVKRDAFLPQGSHGLKAVTKAKLGYDPIEVDPEKMLESAQKTPKEFCAYSVSDALATYYLYRLMIHDFIYALCTIIPTNPDEVLRKGSGTLCEELLMAQAYRRNIIIPDKQVGEFEKFFKGHLIDSETYIGGHVECLNVGVYRTDIPTTFTIDPTAYDFLIDNIDNYLSFTLEIENKNICDITAITNYDAVVNDIKERLNAIKTIATDAPNNTCDFTPIIYHLDVGAMYPNIILTNKLQPVSMVNEQVCSGCIHNKENSQCKRYMNWNWRGELFPLSRSEYENLKHQYEFELLNSTEENDIQNINVDEYRKKFIKRIKTYCSKVYKQVHMKKIELKEGIVCQKENSFYIDTIRNFRDRRYEFKFLVKKWKGKLEEAKSIKDSEAIQNAKNMMELYESLQLAHKIILNSFYGYVMRKGSRWFSMEMAAMTTHCGSNLITDAREFCDRIGKPLELDTDGIWCCLPKGFPEVYKLNLSNGKKINFSFPCTMLNRMIYYKYSNTQYNEYNANTNEWDIRTDMSIFFEVDGPYKAMVLPAAKEEGKMLKKRYAVFGFDNRITELKGFELKRRGELKIIKIFQAEVFGQFLKGNNITECYAACAEIAGRWYSILEAEGEGIPDEELIDYIEESRMMSKSLEEYGSQKSTTITCAKRLAEILGNELLKDKGLCAKFIISKKPLEAPVAERAIPTVIFQSEAHVKRKLLRKWLNDYTLNEIDMRDVIDWEYYKERLAGNILKIVIIPAAMQKVDNPYPNISYPDWVNKMMQRKTNEQKNIKNFFKQVSNVDRMITITEDLEKLDIVKKEGNAKKGKDNNNNNNNNGGNRSSNTNKIDRFLKAKPIIAYETDNNINNTNNISNNALTTFNEDIININDDFNSWLSQQKRKWKFFINNKKRLSQPTTTTLLHSQTSSSLSTNIISPLDYSINTKSYQEKEKLFKTTTLSIIRVTENPNIPGILSLWVLFGTNNIKYLEQIHINMKRKIYINALKQNVPDVFKPSKCTLPRNKPVLNLYEFELEEKDFRDKFNNFNDYIINQTIEGVYETKVPLKFHLLKDYGCNIRFCNRKKISTHLRRFIFSYDDFAMCTNDDIQNGDICGNECLGKIFVYHSTLGLRHFIACINYTTKQTFISIVNPVNKNIEVPNVKKVMQNILNKEFGDNNNNTNQQQQHMILDFDVISSVESDIKLALKNLNKHLLQYQNETNANIPNATRYLLILQSALSIEKYIEYGITAFDNEYPIMQIPFNTEENEFPALDWIKYALTKLTYRYIDLTSVYDFRNQLSNYCNIPICNLENDPTLTSADLIFSRVLKGSKQILWYSSSGFPDLGGGDMNHDFLGNVECEFPIVNNAGMYLGYVAEVDIGLFCVNAVLESEHMKDFSGKYELSYIDKDNRKRKTQGIDIERISKEENLRKMEEYKLERDEFALGGNAFIVMKKMVEKWLDDVREYENICADYLLVHFYRWIASFNSKFYDPVIYRMINLLMQKYFSILIRKISEFGFDIVYADNKKIMIFNHKSNFNDFQTNVEFLFRSIKKIPIFNHIVLTVNSFWKLLLFKDLHNYAGVPASDENINEDGYEIHSMPKIVSKWTWSEFLPPILEKDFISVISDYIMKLYRFYYMKDAEMVLNLNAFYGSNNDNGDRSNDIENVKQMLMKINNSNMPYMASSEENEIIKEFKSFLIHNYISNKLFNILPNIMMKRRNYNDEYDDEYEQDYDINMSDDNVNSVNNNNVNDMDGVYDYDNDNEKVENDNNNNNEQPVFTREDFIDEYDVYSDEYEDDNDNEYEDALNYKKIITKKEKRNNNNNNSTNSKRNNNNTYQNKTNSISSLWQYPPRLGTYDMHTRTNLAIEYVNFVCEALNLDKTISTQVLLLKRNCLKLTNTQEYSKESYFRDPCRTFILRDVICECCSNSKDIDFCRDANILSNNFSCENCHAVYDKGMIEYLLVRKLQKVIDYYYNQDLQCAKCGNQKNEMLLSLCKCAGEFKKTFEENFLDIEFKNMNSIQDLMQTILDIASYYNFDMVKSLVKNFVY